MSVSFQSLTKRFGADLAIDSLDLDIEPESFTVFCGPPKCGKSVLFRLLVGLETPDSGSIILNGTDITRIGPANRQVGYVPQSFALYPHLTVYQNIAYPLTLARRPKDEIARRVDRAAGILSITHLLEKTPDLLSGGEKQRTAVARGLLHDASVFVLDDPLVGLDYKLRERLMDELKSLQTELKATFLYATSDSMEALTMAERLIVLDKGRKVQDGSVETVYREPDHLRAMELIGFPRANLIGGRHSSGLLEAGPFRIPLHRDTPGEVVIGIRPEAIKLGGNQGIAASAEVRLVEDLGSEYVVYLDSNGQALTAAYPVGDSPAPAFQSSQGFAVEPRDIVIFDAGSGARIGRGAA
ncbi:ABC transporter ATP-binding protein [Pelagibius litoralis]|uniref:ABC transporter ATP-binding protein n=1 Tax=Pelagibius litoralis TaxID=374515 RepID=A0A967EY36_9PROT|nr:ABC transporter ATP-binding protein [Pelagibius litoralis]NIA69544.1 ABC transporter ATP-binding protein [Pelagibius litoralis]